MNVCVSVIMRGAFADNLAYAVDQFLITSTNETMSSVTALSKPTKNQYTPEWSHSTKCSVTLTFVGQFLVMKSCENKSIYHYICYFSISTTCMFIQYKINRVTLQVEYLILVGLPTLKKRLIKEV